MDDLTPSAWLWAEIARRYGADAERELHEAYTLRNRQYNRDRWAPVVQPKPVQGRKRRLRDNEDV